MKASIRAATEKAFEWLSVAVGLLILGSCTYAGFGKSEGVAVSVGLVVLGVITAVALVAFVFMMTRTSADIRAIRDRVDKSEPGE